MNDEELTDEAIEFAQNYINAFFKEKNMSDVSLAVNSVAHGFFMGYRYSEKSWGRLFFPRRKIMKEKKLELISLKAAKEYTRKNNLRERPFEDQVLSVSTLAYGFRHGVKDHESRI